MTSLKQGGEISEAGGWLFRSMCSFAIFVKESKIVFILFFTKMTAFVGLTK